MEKINIAELLKNCPKGMKLDCTMFDNVKFISVEEGDKPICIRTDDIYRYLTKFGTWTFDDNAKCVIFPKGKTTWEGFHRPFEDGDVVAGKNYACSYITIFRKFINDDSFNHHVCLTSFGTFKFDGISDNANLRFATKEEKKKLFDAIKAKGYKWDEKTKTLKKLIEPKFKVGDIIQDKDKYKVKITEVNVEDECYEYESKIAKGIGIIGFARQDEWELVPAKFDISTLKPFESKVLIRGGEECFWKPAIFGFCIKINFYVLGGNVWEQCIPYEGNEHLLGTTDDCDEFYKNWE